ncbi:hypothetical protein NDU88_002044 [Pleurodeles waltl]|uniref:Uncharacterized protein n=1 Tax=Pleurodeles waltl TaxID=8319 RepID=A0AAV7MNG1_PLEWA|nr:hypothetical protein NDU88_002044 [Pleurodeles waltl]
MRKTRRNKDRKRAPWGTGESEMCGRVLVRPRSEAGYGGCEKEKTQKQRGRQGSPGAEGQGAGLRKQVNGGKHPQTREK